MNSDQTETELAQALGTLPVDAQRREQVYQSAAAAEIPSYLQVVDTEVMVSLSPDLLPYSQIDYDRFLDMVSSAYRLKPRFTKQVSDVVSQVAEDSSRLTPAQQARI